MSSICPACKSSIPIDDINVSTDIALCRTCGKTFSFSEFVRGSTTGGPDLSSPPRGAWFEQFSQGFRVGASARSWMAVFLVPFTCVWAGFALSSIYGKQIKSGHLDPFASLFGLPFLIGSCFLIGMCAMTLAGKVEISQIEDRLTIFIGVGLLGWSRRFLWSDFTSVREDSRLSGFNFNGRGSIIVLEGKRRVAFGTMLSEERRYFVVSALQKMLKNSARIQSLTIMTPIFR